MSIEMLVQQNRTNRTFDISELVGDVEWTTSIITSQPGKLLFKYVEDAAVNPEEGDFVRFRFNGRGVFLGRIFKKKRNQKGIMEVTAYDSMRFLKNKQTYNLQAMTSAQIFRMLCREHELAFRVVNDSFVAVPAKLHENKSLYSILKNAFETTLISNREWYFVRDNFGVLEHVHINSQQTPLVIGDNSMASGYEFTGSIDDDTFNRVRLVRENPETNRREIYIVQNSSNINRWGRLQFSETVDANLNPGQVEARAELILQAKNRRTRELKISALGDLRIRAGNGVVTSIERLRNEGFANIQRTIVCQCTHKWSKGAHVMDLEMRTVN